jgi:signal transduction histidine kinase/DNA-binding response OmpR family regulator
LLRARGAPILTHLSSPINSLTVSALWVSVIGLTFSWKVLRLQRSMGSKRPWGRWLTLATIAACSQTGLLAAMHTTSDAVLAGLIFSGAACVGAILPAAMLEVLAGLNGMQRPPARPLIWLCSLAGAGLIATSGNGGVAPSAIRVLGVDYLRIVLPDALLPYSLIGIATFAVALAVLYANQRHTSEFSRVTFIGGAGLLGALLLDVFSAIGHTQLPLINGIAGIAFVLIVSLVVEARLRTQILLFERRTEGAQTRAKARSRFLAHMSHELRTPLNGVLGMVQILLDDSRLTVEARQLVRSLGAAARKLGHLIEEILDLERIAGDASHLTSQPFSPTSLLTQVCDAAKHLMATDKVAITFRPLPSHQSEILLIGDADRLKEALLNLVTNALKYTREGQIELSCRMSEAPDASMRVVFSLRDTGSGVTNLSAAISPQKPQQDAPLAHHPLSLGITLRLAELMGGRFTVQSASGHGSTFSLTLRLPVAPKAVTCPATNEDPLPPEGLFGATIMVVDDHPVNRLVTATPLERLGATVLCAATGEDALAVMEEQAVDLVLMDLHMPGIDGVEASARIRAAEHRGQLAHPGRVPVVAVSADSSPEARGGCRDGGMVDFLAKPFDAKTLTNIVHKHLPSHCSVSAPSALPPSSTSTEPSAGNMAFVLDLVSGHRDLAESLLKEYLTSTPSLLKNLEYQCQTDDLDEAKMTAHTIKGSSLSLGFEQVGTAARHLETMLKTGAIEGVPSGLRVLRHAEAQAEESIRSFLEADR